MAQEATRVFKINCPNCETSLEITATVPEHPLTGAEETLHFRGEVVCGNCGIAVEIAVRAQDHPFGEGT